ncbi:hypothetical protein [Bilifractor porci]|uniref:Uncharacterized protein n=1 Tax=Bilifractor porci TaxID=2606636 RepID=A0A7X2TNQ2_9FIRM|nr:hypothetical protein [Bilifractor porci]MST82492.1 hypothetical protein [Bilifractor porci]
MRSLIDVETAKSILQNDDKLYPGMKKYKHIMDSLHWTDVSKDRDFQRTFNGFFKVIFRNDDFYTLFYSYLESHKETAVTFEETLEHLKQAEGQLELSFSSKLIAVINPKRPIWDKIVAVNHFGMVVPTDDDNRQERIVRLYHEYCSRYYEYIYSNEGQTLIRLFDERYPSTGFSDAKKIDFILWADA